jgi:nicotinamidase/pyrazinamidase
MTQHAPTALIVVDAQVGFCEGGNLPVEGGSATCGRIADFVEEHRDDYTLVVATRDWHPPDLPDHFSATPDYIDTWPAHCVAGTSDAEFHPSLRDTYARHVDELVSKGQTSAAYSGFEGRTDAGEPLADLLRRHHVEAVDVVGIAASHCVRATALSALAEGFAVTVLEDLTVGVTPDLKRDALDEIERRGGHISRSDSTS